MDETLINAVEELQGTDQTSQPLPSFETWQGTNSEPATVSSFVNAAEDLQGSDQSSQTPPRIEATNGESATLSHPLPIPTITVTPPEEEMGISNGSGTLTYTTHPPHTSIPKPSPYYDLATSELVAEIEGLQNDLRYPMGPIVPELNEWLQEELADRWVMFCREIHHVFINNLSCTYCGEEPRVDLNHETPTGLEKILDDVSAEMPEDVLTGPVGWLENRVVFLTGVEERRRWALAEEGCPHHGEGCPICLDRAA